MQKENKPCVYSLFAYGILALFTTNKEQQLNYLIKLTSPLAVTCPLYPWELVNVNE